jgi:hypothetical protein
MTENTDAMFYSTRAAHVPRAKARPHRSRLEHGRSAGLGVSRGLRGLEGRDDLVREVAGGGTGVA